MSLDMLKLLQTEEKDVYKLTKRFKISEARDEETQQEFLPK